jgi:hypothetical protein
LLVRRLAMRARAQGGSPNTAPKRNRAWLFVWLTLGAGTASGVAALAGGWVTDIEAQFSNLTAGNATATPIEAQALFPPVQAVHKVIDVYDPPPPAAQPKPQPKPPAAAPTPTPTPRHHPSPTPIHSSPSPTPPND